jgi:hypothetical protein
MRETNAVQFEEGTLHGIVSIGRLRLLEDGRIKKEPDPDTRNNPGERALANEQILDEILGEEVRMPDGEILKKEDDPKLWFKRLPYKYNGTYFWAKFV